MKLDVLALGAHPDDVEMSCTGTLLASMAAGKKVGIVDFTRGELGTRGTPEIRAAEAAASNKILGIDIRENLGLPDGFFRNDREHQLPLIAAIRRYRPDVGVFAAVEDVSDGSLADLARLVRAHGDVALLEAAELPYSATTILPKCAPLLRCANAAGASSSANTRSITGRSRVCVRASR